MSGMFCKSQVHQHFRDFQEPGGGDEVLSHGEKCAASCKLCEQDEFAEFICPVGEHDIDREINTTTEESL